ncbi:MAG: hypothetical protein KJ718_05320 [Nanoarchaeota archaeon]|nr:hypothetical protein [Nanoarchaeota archaeon]MBU1051943.1 hypothetical protein [Nanoarchaeota archaeon]MBU1988226.1 hypothetical protein [Nanoarchaeota archaeon]
MEEQVRRDFEALRNHKDRSYLSRPIQVGLTTIIMFAGLNFLRLSGDTPCKGIGASENTQAQISQITPTPYLFDENEPHKYDPSPSSRSEFLD